MLASHPRLKHCSVEAFTQHLWRTWVLHMLLLLLLLQG
jgi:hypothetical protein